MQPGSSDSDFNPSAGSGTDASFESDSGSDSAEGEPDVSGIYDDADYEQFNQAKPCRTPLMLAK